MNIRSNISCLPVLLAALCLSACAATKPEVSTDLNAGLEVATALETAYAARPSADPKIVADLTRLMASAQAAIGAWEVSTSPADAALANAAIAAFVAYEASAHITP